MLKTSGDFHSAILNYRNTSKSATTIHQFKGCFLIRQTQTTLPYTPKQLPVPAVLDFEAV